MMETTVNRSSANTRANRFHNVVPAPEKLAIGLRTLVIGTALAVSVGLVSTGGLPGLMPSALAQDQPAAPDTDTQSPAAPDANIEAQRVFIEELADQQERLSGELLDLVNTIVDQGPESESGQLEAHLRSLDGILIDIMQNAQRMIDASATVGTLGTKLYSLLQLLQAERDQLIARVDTDGDGQPDADADPAILSSIEALAERIGALDTRIERLETARRNAAEILLAFHDARPEIEFAIRMGTVDAINERLDGMTQNIDLLNTTLESIRQEVEDELSQAVGAGG